MPSEQISPSRLPCATTRLVGRDQELNRLRQAWDDESTRIVSIIAPFGVGKTSLVFHWQTDLMRSRHDGFRYFDWSFHAQGSLNHTLTSSDSFIASALDFFGDTSMSHSGASPWDKGVRLAQLISREPTLLILDGLEPLLCGLALSGRVLNDPAMVALLRGLLQSACGLCVITARERIGDLIPYLGTTAIEIELSNLPLETGVSLLRELKLHGSDAEFRSMVNEADGHALTLLLLGIYIASACGGDIRQRDRIRIDEADRAILEGQSFKTLAALSEWLQATGKDGKAQWALFTLFGLFDRPVCEDWLLELCKPPAIQNLTEPILNMSRDRFNFLISTLLENRLLYRCLSDDGHANRGLSGHVALDCHPLVRTYLTIEIESKNQKGSQQAHDRLYSILMRDRTEMKNPSLTEIEPFYHAMRHACKAGRPRNAYHDLFMKLILQGNGPDGLYSWKRLGALASDLTALLLFFDRPWSRVIPDFDVVEQVQIQREAAFRLYALTRLSEAVEASEASLRLAENCKCWEEAAISAGLLSKIQLSMGLIAAGKKSAWRSMDYADRSKSLFQRMANRTKLGDAYHMAGNRPLALKYCADAEVLQRDLQPDRPLLHSLRGFRYCEALMAEDEQLAWRITMGLSEISEASTTSTNVESLTFRIKSSLKWAIDNNWLLDIALDMLSLGKLHLYQSLRGIGDIREAKEIIGRSMEEIRRSGQKQHFPRVLMVSAWISKTLGDTDAVNELLNEARYIAEQGSLQLHVADTQLYRARLLKDKPALLEARGIVQQCQYGRRMIELSDAEKAAEHW